jgi:hypothetical protein
MLEKLWNSILDLTRLLVIPDWGAIIALLPVFMTVVVILWALRTVAMFRSVGPARRRPGRVRPPTPPGIHMPGPTWAPPFGAAGTFLLFLGLVFPGPLLVLGVAALVLALLFWGAEGLRDYDHVAGDHPQLEPPVHAGPPPGVHMPGPSFRPVLAALGVFVLFLGLVFPGPIIFVGILFTIVALLGWLNDARKEYRHVVAADQIGHIENEPAPGWPKVVVGVFTFLLVAAVAINNGWIPPRSTSAGTAGPGGSAAPSGGPGGSGGPAGPGGLNVIAKGVKFDQTALTAPADQPFKINFDNQDQGTPHDVDILDGSGAKVFDGKDFPGVAQRVYDVPALKAGAYKFECSIHPALMNGQLTVGG